MKAKIILFLFIFAAVVFGCPLSRFPNQISSSLRLTSQIDIEEYVDIEYPLPTSDLTHL